MVDIYYNRGGFEDTIDFLIGSCGKGPFGFYEMLADYYYEKGYQNRDRKKEDQSEIRHTSSRPSDIICCRVCTP